LKAREPKLVEDTKKTIFLYGQRSTEMLKYFFADLVAITKPHSKLFNRKKEILPFDDAEPVEYLTKKEDSPCFIFGNTTKKRPNNVIMGRTFDFQLLDMIEFGLESLKPIVAFKATTNAFGSKPCLIFQGDLFETDPVFQAVKSIFVDIFRGDVVTNLSIEGLDHVISVTAIEGKVLFRHYGTVLKKSGTRVPLIELEEIGPRADLAVRRSTLATADRTKMAYTRPTQGKPKKHKNTVRNAMGDKLGRIHMQKQDIDKLQTRKVRALKKSKAPTADDAGSKKKKRRTAPEAGDEA
jgi:ribosome production factor 2